MPHALPGFAQTIHKTEGINLEALQKKLVRQALDMSGNNQTKAAELLGMTRAKFRVLLKHADR